MHCDHEGNQKLLIGLVAGGYAYVSPNSNSNAASEKKESPLTPNSIVLKNKSFNNTYDIQVVSMKKELSEAHASSDPEDDIVGMPLTTHGNLRFSTCICSDQLTR